MWGNLCSVTAEQHSSTGTRALCLLYYSTAVPTNANCTPLTLTRTCITYGVLYVPPGSLSIYTGTIHTMVNKYAGDECALLVTCTHGRADRPR